MTTVEIDEEVFAFLQSRVRTFNETPNSVLRREFGFDKASAKIGTEKRSMSAERPLPSVSVSSPAALRQIVHVVSLVRCSGLDRVSATQKVASVHSVERETVADKYGRQLGLTTQQFDQLLKEDDLAGLKTILLKKYPRESVGIAHAFDAIAACK